MRSSLRASTLMRNATPLWPDSIQESLHESSPGQEASIASTPVESKYRFNTNEIMDSDLISRLRARVDQLEQELDNRNSTPEVDNIRQEWLMSEELLQQSQRDNALKHEKIEQYKVYVKEIERLCTTMIGPDWRIEHDIRTPFSQSTGFSASTPLPKPSVSSLRRSTSLISPSKRNSRSIHRHASTAGLGRFTLNPVPFGSVMNSTNDDTPTGAMRKLTGSAAPQPTVDTGVDGQAISRFSRAPTAEPHTRSTTNAQLPNPSLNINAETDGSRLRQIQGLLIDLVGRKDDAKGPAIFALCEQSKKFVLESERRAEAREKRLMQMLEEAQNCWEFGRTAMHR